jgi:hypothetical protein
MAAKHTFLLVESEASLANLFAENAQRIFASMIAAVRTEK